MNIHRQNRYIPRFFYLCLLALAALSVSSPSRAEIAVGISVTVAPPALPVYVQPPIPAPGYIWTPGYWAYGPAGYYWVPGTWVLPPAVGLLWTPGYWGWSGGAYIWHAGYWGPHVGFYGGINYGFGYVGVGYLGGYWDHGAFRYNSAVNNVRNVNITNVYNKTVIVNKSVTNVSFNGGAGGTLARPTAQELAAEHDHHVQPTAMQAQHEHAASTNRALWHSENHGRPMVAATARPGEFSGKGVVAARAGRENGPHPNNRQPGPQHAEGPHPGPQHAEGPHPGPQHAQNPHGGGQEHHEEGHHEHHD